MDLSGSHRVSTSCPDPSASVLPVVPRHLWPPFRWHLSHSRCALGMVPSQCSPSLGLGDQHEQIGPWVAWDGWHWL